VPLATYSITNSLQQAVNSLFSYLPNIIGFLIILIIGYIIAKLVRTVINKLLAKLRVDERLQATPAGEYVEKVSPGGRPSRIVGGLVFWLIFLYVLTAAIGALKIPSVTAFMNQVLAYLPNVIAAVLIFVIAAALSGGVAAVVNKIMGDTPTGKLAEAVAPGLIMAIAIFMVLNQLQIAPAIVTITFAALLGMLALTGALAFGLGGREVAAKVWAQAYDRSQDAADRARQDAQTGRQRAESEAQARTGGADGGSTSGLTRSGNPPRRPS
jgi:hypothetical protein